MLRSSNSRYNFSDPRTHAHGLELLLRSDKMHRSRGRLPARFGKLRKPQVTMRGERSHCQSFG
jgi:hypothetical protein